MQNFEKVYKIAQDIKKQLKDRPKPSVAVILGTGLGALAELVKNPLYINYADLAGLPTSTVSSHRGRFVFGELNGVELVIQQGRFHLYEGYSPAELCLGVRIMCELGAKSLIVSNSAGCLNPHWDTGSMMLIKDHINFTGTSPLLGSNHDDKGLRFPDMAKVYDQEYQNLAMQVAQENKLRLERGVYIGLHGPEFETPAETRMYKHFGADAVGMSTVLEVIAARHLQMRVLGLSVLSNKNLPDCMGDISIEDIVQATQETGENIANLLSKLIGLIK